MWRLVFLLVSCLTPSLFAQLPTHRRFEYKHSFRAPNLAQRDGSIPFWMVTGDAIASGEQLRLAPSMRSRRGIAWNKRAMVESENFEINLEFKITGQGRIGADGMAVWYTAQQGTLGQVFGANDYWTGMGLFFDSFDNDGKKNNPYVALMINDGTRKYEHHMDGSEQIVAGCHKDFRNKPFPVHAKVVYIRNVLTLEISDGMQPVPRYDLCLRAENIFLPRNGFFGVSAATGGLADDHDIIDFSVFSLLSDKVPIAQTLGPEEKQKYVSEFDRQMEEYEKDKKRYKEQHPDRVKEDAIEEDIAKLYEDATQRDLRLIYAGQNEIFVLMQQIQTKLAEIRQQQEAHTSMLQQYGAVVPREGQRAAPVGDGFLLHEKNEALQSLRDLTSTIRDMKNYVNEIFTRTYNMEQRLSSQGSQGAVGSVSDGNLGAFIESIQNDIRLIRTAQLDQAQGRSAAATGCPNVACLTSSFFLIIIVLQSIGIGILLILRGKQEKAKFY